MILEQVFPALGNAFTVNVWPHVLQYVITFSPVIMMVTLAAIFWDLWVRYVRSKYFFSQKYSLLEIKLPKDMYKSPLAMELFINAFHNTADGNWYKAYWVGETRPWWSLELVSIEGQVKFYIWMRASAKTFIETNLYAQFPGIEVHERDDYARSVHFDPATEKVWATEFKLTGDEYLPIKTYMDYGLEKDPKEEFKVDPIAPLLEFLGSIGPNQQLWYQFIIRPHKKEQTKPGHWFKKTDTWKDEAAKKVNEILMRDPKTKVSGMKDEESGYTKMPTISKGEQAIVESIERKMTKFAFDTGIRAVYIAKKDFFNPGNIGGTIGSMKHFSSEHLNGFKPGGPWMGKLEYPWQDYRDYRRNLMSKRVLKAYKRRAYFYAPFHHKSFVLNAEELATLFHFPGAVAATPTLGRIPSKKAEAPSNLPI